MLSPRRAFLSFLAAALAVTGLGACASESKQPPLESLQELVARLEPHVRGGAIAMTDAPASYRLEYDLYVKGHTTGDTGVDHGKARTLLDATKVVRDVVRPFNESGAVQRSLGFVREANSVTSRVSFVRPLPDDPRPQVYPPSTAPQFRRQIAGRVCASYVVDGDEYCIDKQGIVLLTRTANSVELVKKVTVGNQTKAADELARSLAKGFVNKDRGSIRPLDPDTAPEGATDYSLDAPPDGFALVGRYAVVPLTAEILKRTSRQVVAGIVDVYVRGADAVVIERGGKLDTTEVGDQDLGTLVDAHDVDLGLLGAGQAGIGGNGPFGYREVRANPSKGRYVVVAGTLPEDALVAIARSLRGWPGDGMRFLDKR